MPGPHGGVIDVFSPIRPRRFADRMLALMGATETGRVEIVALADRRVNTLLAFADTDRDAAISQAEADAMQATATRGCMARAAGTMATAAARRVGRARRPDAPTAMAAGPPDDAAARVPAHRARAAFGRRRRRGEGS